MAAKIPMKVDLATPGGRDVGIVMDLLRELHMRVPEVYAYLQLIGNGAALEAATTELGLANNSDGTTGTALLDLFFAIDAAIGGISVADINRAYNGKMVSV